MAQTFSCGYAIAVILDGSNRYTPANVHDGILSDFVSKFENSFYHPYTQSALREKFKTYLKFISKNKKNVTVAVKRNIIDEFSASEWLKLPEEQKREHSLNDCKVSITHFFQ